MSEREIFDELMIENDKDILDSLIQSIDGLIEMQNKIGVYVEAVEDIDLIDDYTADKYINSQNELHSFRENLKNLKEEL